jgi:hypothetical protein
MNLNTMSRGWTAAVAAAILATVAALAIVGMARAASVSNLSVGSATVAPGESVTITVTGDLDDVGSYRVDVQYDSSLVTATECESSDGVCSIDTVANDTVRLNGSNLSGISEDGYVLGTITFTAGSTEGVADLTVDTTTLILSDTTGESLTATPGDGAITIVAPTATPEVTEAPTATPGSLPDTGDGWTPSSTAGTMVWLLAATGLVIAAAGAWVLSRAGREN